MPNFCVTSPKAFPNFLKNETMSRCTPSMTMAIDASSRRLFKIESSAGRTVSSALFICGLERVVAVQAGRHRRLHPRLLHRDRPVHGGRVLRPRRDGEVGVAVRARRE